MNLRCDGLNGSSAVQPLVYVLAKIQQHVKGFLLIRDLPLYPISEIDT